MTDIHKILKEPEVVERCADAITRGYVGNEFGAENYAKNVLQELSTILKERGV